MLIAPTTSPCPRKVQHPFAFGGQGGKQTGLRGWRRAGERLASGFRPKPKPRAARQVTLRCWPWQFVPHSEDVAGVKQCGEQGWLRIFVQLGGEKCLCDFVTTLQFRQKLVDLLLLLGSQHPIGVRRGFAAVERAAGTL